jgi:histone H3/H4
VKEKEADMAKFQYGFRKVDMELLNQVKKPGETYYQVCKRLEREGKLESRAFHKPERKAITASTVKKYLKRRGMMCSADTVAELEKAIMVILDASIHNARRDKRKTVKAVDVRGDSTSLFGR